MKLVFMWRPHSTLRHALCQWQLNNVVNCILIYMHSNVHPTVLASDNFRTSILHDFAYKGLPQEQIRIEEMFN
jgi:hypothetical protein